MKIRRVSLFFSFCFFVTISVAQTGINQFDAEGKRHGLWKKTYDGSKQTRYEGAFEHGKEVGEFKFYCESCKDVPSTIIVYSPDSSISEVKYFTAKGKLVSEGKMDGQQRTGEWVYYHENSKIPMARENYVNGKLHGKMTTYYPNGELTEERNYEMGVLEGDNKYFSPEGVLIKKLFYKDNLLQGPAVYYDAYGKTAIEGVYKKGKKHGLWKYYKDGKVVLEETYPKPLPEKKGGQ